MTEPLLVMRNVSKTFGSTRVLDDVEFSLVAGEIHALMGENGAGKSTLMKVLAGAYLPDPGAAIAIEGKEIRITGPQSSKEAGISIIYQELALAPNLTVAENIYLGRELRKGGLLNRRAMLDDVEPILRRLQAPFTGATLVGTLTLANRQLVEIARALHAQSRIIVMDEPTTALSARETDALFSMIKALRADGLGIVYISHRMNEIYELSDRVSVLRDGRRVGTLSGADIEPEKIVRMMVGRDLTALHTKTRRADAGPVVLDVEGLSDGERFRDCSFTLRAGEVVGLAGLVGAGRTELAQSVFGSRPRKGGSMRLNGYPFAPRSPRQAIGSGVIYLTEDRRGEGLFLDLSCEQNINTCVVGRDAALGVVLNVKRARNRAMESIASLSIRVSTPSALVGGLSGGNQQKVLLARLLQTGPKVLILDEPTRGVDVGAKSEIYKIIEGLAKAGAAVLVISSELPELLGIADRVLVMREGEIAGEVGGSENKPITEESIMTLATGLRHAA